jgi:hypothetical protein
LRVSQLRAQFFFFCSRTLALDTNLFSLVAKSTSAWLLPTSESATFVRASFGQDVSWIYLLDGLNLVAGILPKLLRLCLGLFLESPSSSALTSPEAVSTSTK